MGINLSAFLDFLTSAPGTILSYLVPGFALVWLAVLAWTRGKGANNQARRGHILIGCVVLFLLQAIGMASTLSNAVYEVMPFPIYQMTHTATAVLTIIWVVWTFLEEQNKTLQTTITLVLTVVIVGLTAFSLLNYRLQVLFPDMPLFSMQTFWLMAGLLLVLAGIVLILIRRPDQKIIGIVLLSGLGLGLMTQLILGSKTGPMVWFQLAQAISLPGLLALSQRVTQKNEPNQSPIQSVPDEPVNQPVDTKPELVNLLLKISLQEDTVERWRATVRALSLSLVADICYLVRELPDGSHLELIAGYDLIREVYLPTPILRRDELLHIMDAWADRRVLRLSQSHAEVQDVVTLTLLLKVHRIGNLLAYPLHLPDGSIAGGVIIFSPYTNKLFNSNTLRLLDEVQGTLTQVLFGETPIGKVKSELKEKTELMAILRQTIESLNKVLSEKDSMINTLTTDLQQFKAKYQIEKMDSVQQINALQEEIQSLRSQPASDQGLLRQMEQISVQLHQLTEERDQLKLALNRAEARIKHLESQTGQTGPVRLSLDSQIISLDSIAANIRLQISAELQKKALRLEIINPEGRQMVKTDPELLQTLLKGLLDNAIAITPEHGQIQLGLNISLETGMLIAEVTDHGEGLTQDEQTLLFSATETAIPGIGSLPAIRTAIRAIRVLNGKIWLRSVKRQSTTFRVQFPVRIID